MAQNRQHYDTFKLLLDFWGLPPSLVEMISLHLSHIDNTQQDELIRLITREIHKKQFPDKKESLTYK